MVVLFLIYRPLGPLPRFDNSTFAVLFGEFSGGKRGAAGKQGVSAFHLQRPVASLKILVGFVVIARPWTRRRNSSIIASPHSINLMQNPITLIQSNVVAMPIFCKECEANTVAERGKICPTCITKLANLAAIEHGRTFRRMVIGGLAIGIACLVYVCARTIFEALK